ncbi:DNA sulfur modification protein DndB [Brevibacillus sp. NRS-1366]|uniref:DNA sulfur modification protein DndB n=1 Tax=Brevibacillus sp. NRS-1366 TaxID=3233899 RepID=UPI003D206B2A
MPLIERSKIEEKLSEVIKSISNDRKLINKLKKGLSEHGIEAGDTQYIITGRIPLSELSISVLCLITSKLFNETELEAANPENYFTQQEIKQCQSFEVLVGEDKISLPYTLSNVTFVRDANYSTTISAQEIKKLMDSNLLTYNFETQREARVEKDKDDQIVLKPKTNPKSVSEIADLLKTGDLETTTITFNALVNTSDSGEELVFNHKNKSLTITKGTQLNILDGYHRISGIVKALTEDETLDTVFDLKILNYSTRRAIKYFNQINKVNPISESRLKETNLSSMATVTFEELKDKCEFLNGKISSSEKIFTSADHLVSSKVLIDAIDEHFNPSNRIEALQTGQYLSKFFDVLFMSYSEAFVSNIGEVRKVSIINANFMFDGYILLAKKMQELGLSISDVKEILDRVNFERQNIIWKQLGVLDEAGNITTNPKRKIRTLINDLVSREVNSNV